MKQGKQIAGPTILVKFGLLVGREPAFAGCLGKLIHSQVILGCERHPQDKARSLGRHPIGLRRKDAI